MTPAEREALAVEAEARADEVDSRHLRILLRTLADLVRGGVRSVVFSRAAEREADEIASAKRERTRRPNAWDRDAALLRDLAFALRPDSV